MMQTRWTAKSPVSGTTELEILKCLLRAIFKGDRSAARFIPHNRRREHRGVISRNRARTGLPRVEVQREYKRVLVRKHHS